MSNVDQKKPSGPRPGKAARPIDLQNFLPYRFHVLNSRMADAGDGLAKLVERERPNFSLRDWHVIAVLGCHGQLFSGQIGELTAMEPTTVTRAVQSLKAQGLVLTRTSTKDRRRVLVTLSEAGAALHDKVATERIKAGAWIEECLNADEQKMLFQILEKLDRHLEQREAEDSVEEWD